MKIVILGDSLALPRPNEGIGPKDTYPLLIQRSCPDGDIQNKARYRNDTTLQTTPKQMKEDLISEIPDVVIIHLGIVDCAPRLFTRKNHRQLEKIPNFIRHRIVSFASQNRRLITRVRPKTYVSAKRFRENIGTLLTTCTNLGVRVLMLNIAKTHASNAERSYGFLHNIDRYNQIISEMADEFGIPVLDIYALSTSNPDVLLPDGIHLTRYGNQQVSALLVRALGCQEDKEGLL